MPLLRIGATAAVVDVTGFEGMSRPELTLRLELDQGVAPGTVTIDDVVVIDAAAGGYAIDVRRIGPGFLGFGPTPGLAPSTPTLGSGRTVTDQPIEHFVVEAWASLNGVPESMERHPAQAGVTVSGTTLWSAGIEDEPPWLADPPPSLDLQSGRDGVRIGLMGPVDIVDAIVSAPPGYAIQRRLLLSGHILNPRLNKEIADFMADNKKNNATWRVTVRDHSSGKVVVDRALSIHPTFPGFGSARLWDGVAAQFHYALPLPDTTTFATVRLELERAPVRVVHETEAALAPVDVLHFPFDLDTGRWAPPGAPLPPWIALDVGAGPGDHRSNGHNGDMKQRYALDLSVAMRGNTRDPSMSNRLQAYYVYDTPVLAGADGRVILAFDSTPDMVDSSVATSGEPNRVVLRHDHAGRTTYSVYAHLRQGSIEVSVNDEVSAGDVLGRVGSNGESGGPHLHLGYYTFDPWGRPRWLPFAFTLADGTGGAVTGVPPPRSQLWPAPPAIAGSQAGDEPVGVGAAARGLVDAVVTFFRALGRGFGSGR